MTSNAEIAKAMAENMTHAAVPLYGKKLRLPDRGAIIGIIKEFRRLLFPAYFGDAQLMALPPENYAALLLERIETALTAQVALALPEDQALVYHCAAGKDRTGIISILILMALGVDDKTIAEDYLLTDELYDFSIEKQHPTNEKLSQAIAKMNVTRGEGPAVKGITETIRQGWGSFDNFFTRKLGFKQADLEKFREMYLEEEEED